MLLHVLVVQKECSVLACVLQNSSINWFGCIPADSYEINRLFFFRPSRVFSILLTSFKYFSVLFIFLSVA